MIPPDHGFASIATDLCGGSALCVLNAEHTSFYRSDYVDAALGGNRVDIAI